MKNLASLTLILMLTACGTTSSLQHPENHTTKLDLRGYNNVIVNDFTDGVSKSNNDSNIIAEGKRFADIISSSIRSKGTFDKIERNVDNSDHALLINGAITEYTDGNAAARMLFGFGAGSSHFNAKVNVIDNQTKATLGHVTVHKQSWALGGAIAASQDAKSHMLTAASKIANELDLAKKGEKK